MTEHFERACGRMYLVVLLVAFVTWIFHSSVNRKFSHMMMGLEEAATLKRSLAIEELVLFEHYRDSTELHLASRQHIQKAYQFEEEAKALYRRIPAELKEASILSKDADALEKLAQEDEKKASNLEYASLADDLDYMAEKLRGGNLSKRAEAEAMEAREHLVHADELERQGNDLLRLAEARLNATHDSDAVIETLGEGVCQWIRWACNAIERNDPADASKKPNDEAISIAKSFDKALKVLDDARIERKVAMKLLHKSSMDVNESIEVLEQASRHREKAGQERLEAKEYHHKAQVEAHEAEIDEKVVDRDQIEAYDDKKALLAALNEMSAYASEAKEEEIDATQMDSRVAEDRHLVDETEITIRTLTFQAEKDVTHAGWYCAFSVLAALGLFILSAIRIVVNLQSENPLDWLVREEPKTKRDMSYILQHCLLLLLSLAFSGQLLLGFYKHVFLTRIEILVLVSLTGAFFQVVALHLVPNCLRLFSELQLSREHIIALLLENVVKSGLLVFGVFVLEILLLWVNLGTFLFSRFYLLNGWALWILVAASCFIHVVFLEMPIPVVTEEAVTLPTTEPHQRQDSDQVSIEMKPLTAISSSNAGTSSSFVTVHSSSSAMSPVDYGSSGTNESIQFPSEVASTFVTSWIPHMNRLRLLLDLLIASWALWVVRADILIIFKLSPISPGIVWGMLPLWLLGVLILGAVGLLTRTLWKHVSI